MDPISFLAGLITAFLSVLLAGWSYSRISRMPSPWGGYTVSTAPVVERDEDDWLVGTAKIILREVPELVNEVARLREEVEALKANRWVGMVPTETLWELQRGLALGGGGMQAIDHELKRREGKQDG